LNQDSKTEILGLKLEQTIDSIIIQWPNGLEESYFDLPADTSYHFIEGETFSVSLLTPQNLECIGDSALFEAEQGFDSYIWSDGQTGTSAYISTSSEVSYTAYLENGAFFHSDTISLTLNTQSEFDFFLENAPCNGATGSIQSVQLDLNDLASFTVDGSETELLIDSLPAGQYMIEFTNDLGCSGDTTLTISQPDSLFLTTNSMDVSCFGAADGSIQANFAGGIPPYTIISPASLDSLAAGEYSISGQDANGCISVTSAQIMSPEPLSIEVETTPDGGSGGTALGSAEGGTPPYNYAWSTGDTTMMVNGLLEGAYTLSITDANNCADSLDFLISFVSIEESELQNVNLFPNPAEKFVMISSNRKIEQFYMHDFQGRMNANFSSPLLPLRLDVRTWLPGMYSVTILMESGEVSRQTLILQ
ncbi:MAG: hypothetical protein HKN32_04535, partial [Flavobacteriales bacterium]|nr:hypothetical protein [Flavobacteriales bacterium]